MNEPIDVFKMKFRPEMTWNGLVNIIGMAMMAAALYYGIKMEVQAQATEMSKISLRMEFDERRMVELGRIVEQQANSLTKLSESQNMIAQTLAELRGRVSVKVPNL